jgi:hypothetical protein
MDTMARLPQQTSKCNEQRDCEMRHVSANRSKLLSAFFKHGQKSLSAVQWTNTRGTTHGRLEERWGLLCLLSRKTVWVENGLRVWLYHNPDVLVNRHLAIRKDCELLEKTVSVCNLPTYCMEQSPSWETNRFSPSQIPRIVRNTKVHYRNNNSPPPVHIILS